MVYIKREGEEKMNILEGLQPQKVFKYFERICQIPHGSGNIEQISNYIADFAKERGMFCIQDELKNIIIQYLPVDAHRNNQLYATLFDIYNCESWLAQHSEVEDHIFIPAVRLLEKQINQSNISQKLSNMINKNSDADVLSDRERDVIVCLVQGMTNKEMADHLCISINTVITHRKNIARKLQIHSPAGLTVYAIAKGLIDMSAVKL